MVKDQFGLSAQDRQSIQSGIGKIENMFAIRGKSNSGNRIMLIRRTQHKITFACDIVKPEALIIALVEDIGQKFPVRRSRYILGFAIRSYVPHSYGSYR